MATTIPESLYIIGDDLYRFGNSTSPKLDNVRQRDVQTYYRNDVEMVKANRKGISLLTQERLNRMLSRSKGSYVWRLAARVPLTPGLILVPDLDKY